MMKKIISFITFISAFLVLGLSTHAQTVIISHDFETDNGWTTSDSLVRDNSSFTGSDGNHWHTTPFNDYNNDMDEYVTSGSINLSGYANLTLVYNSF